MGSVHKRSPSLDSDRCEVENFRLQPFRIHFRPDSKEDMLSVISQQEHPVLLRPFFMVHPCKTWEFLSDTSEKTNVLVKFITSVGPVVNLSINYSYGKI